MKTKTEGELEIDHSRGVIYFHSKGGTVLRICGLPTPVPLPISDILDITLKSEPVTFNWKANQPMTGCPVCGGSIIGDGYTMVLHCENAESNDIMDSEPDAPIILCSRK